MAESVKAWDESVSIPTYPVAPADLHPMFLEKRVYQGSSGRVYPNAFTDQVSDHKVEKTYRAVFLENEYVRLMILPEIGGRIHIGLDKTNNYDFFYRQDVIKPALVGLLGPWISGGVEFNWPQHHRPSTYMPVEWRIEEHEDGSRTVWLSEHEPMTRMKGMVGICLYPGCSLVEAKVRLHNRTPLAQTFLWWANAGIRVHEQYQAFFPPDVHFVADHAKRAMSSYPIAENVYYGVDYRPGVDISWYKNIPVPTSYMVTRSKYDFFGGYDYQRRAGVIHYADHHIAPGKKLWTWGNAEFGYAWDRELTDSGGPYIELMAGAYTDNQPDFSWLAPFETRTFRQYWYPIQQIGPAKNANAEAAVNLKVQGNRFRAGVSVTRRRQITVSMRAGGTPLVERTAEAAPGAPVLLDGEVPPQTLETDLMLVVTDAEGGELIRYRPESPSEEAADPPADEPSPPAQVATIEELYLTGLHLQQYRHATRRPEDYWTEALRRDPGDARSNNAMGLLLLRRGEFARAEERFRAAVERLTRRNPNPYEGEPYYNLALALRFQGRLEEAYAAFYKAAWNHAWYDAAYYALAQIECLRHNFAAALQHLGHSRAANARNLEATVRRYLGEAEAAGALSREVLAADPLDCWARNELAPIATDVQTALDLAFDYAGAGFRHEATAVLEPLAHAPKPYPMVLYTLGWLAGQQGDTNRALACYARASQAPPDYCFPARLEEMLVLDEALRAVPGDARAHYYLGCLLYDKQRHEDAIRHWEAACKLDPDFAFAFRNLGIAYYNVRRDPARALECYRKAFAANPHDARVLYELDQLLKRLGTGPEERVGLLEKHPDLVSRRDDLTVELVALYNLTGRAEEALRILSTRRFHPWEGGEGLVSGQWVAAHRILGRALLDRGDGSGALEHFEAARHYPENLGEGKHLLTLETDLDYFSGLAQAQIGRKDDALRCWRAAAACEPGIGTMAFYRAMALIQSGEIERAATLLAGLLEGALERMNLEQKIDYFATSLPNFLLFEDDLQNRSRAGCTFLVGLARLGLGDAEGACKAFRETLSLDANHIGAAEELRRAGSRALSAQ